MKAKDVADFAFQRLQILIAENRIKPGSLHEREFLKHEIGLGLYNLFSAHGHSFFPSINVEWNPIDPDDLLIYYCEKTNQLINKLGLV